MTVDPANLIEVPLYGIQRDILSAKERTTQVGASRAARDAQMQVALCDQQLARFAAASAIPPDVLEPHVLEWTNSMFVGALAAANAYAISATKGRAHPSAVLSAASYYGVAAQLAANNEDRAQAERLVGEMLQLDQANEPKGTGLWRDRAIVERVRYEYGQATKNARGLPFNLTLKGLSSPDINQLASTSPRVAPYTLVGLVTGNFARLKGAYREVRPAMQTDDVYEWAYNSNWQATSAPAIYKALGGRDNAGKAAFVKVASSTKTFTLAVHNRDGAVVVMNGQNGDVQPLSENDQNINGFQGRYQLMTVNDIGPNTLLRVDEITRADEVRRVIDLAGDPQTNFRARRAYMHIGMPPSVLHALSNIAKSEFADSPIGRARKAAQSVARRVNGDMRSQAASISEELGLMGMKPHWWGLPGRMQAGSGHMVVAEAEKLQPGQSVMAYAAGRSPFLISNIDGWVAAVELNRKRATPLSQDYTNGLLTVDIDAYAIEKGIGGPANGSLTD